MNPLSSVTAIVLLVVVLLPGVPGETAYRRLVGRNWRDETWQRVVRLIFFSALGLALYSFVATVAPLPPPSYLAAEDLAQVFGAPFPLLAHFVASGLVGAGAGWGVRRLARKTAVSVFSSAWDELVLSRVGGHWVVVSLVGGESYAGFIENADHSVKEDERDILLTEPAEFDESSGRYLAMQYQHLFLPGSRIISVAVVYDPQKDGDRIVGIGEPVFETTESAESVPDKEKTA